MSTRPDPTRRQVSRQQLYRRRRIAAAIVLVLTLGIVSVAIYLPTAAAAELPDAAPTVETPAFAPAAPVAAAFPGYGRGAIGAVGFDGVLASAGDQGQFPIASITKVITALVVLSAKPLADGEAGPDITFTDADVDIYYDVLAQNGSLEPVREGLVLSQRQVMETMLIPSANNYAESLAVWAFGSVDAYLTAANAWLTEHGLTDTVVVDTNGLSPGDLSTPANLVALGQLALADPVIASIVRTPTAQEPYIGEIDNTNKLLGISGVDGIKTGTTDEAGACLLFSTDVVVGSQSVTVVGVILGADSHPELNDGVLALLESVTPGFHEVTLTTAGQQYAAYSTLWGESSTAVTTEARTALVYGDETVTAAVVAAPVEAAAAGTQVGTVTFTVGDETIDVPLTLAASIDAPDFWWRVSNPPWTR
ncbi:D-alanyl-D-alanine carboxypeptidase family protein [Amnibacterium flavum]|uniref:D-alanyl-D-alanine carboxypeptidase n=1 Tax=Amnibacterium flavum TaxID=2173173 RepID=A0A2V1HVQ3_9MICO|nr:serine hydrolase [Amnibacterium flavum]PVZ94457.1 D-alanyl-D-alanine carboxypeptidase [Amnibacterium flavum]